MTTDLLCLDAQLYPTVCDSMDCSPPGSSVHGDSPGKNIGVDCHALLQRIFLTQGSNPGLPHCMQILYHLSHQGKPIDSLVVSFPVCTIHLLVDHVLKLRKEPI